MFESLAKKPHRDSRGLLLFIGVLVTAASLRAPFTAIGPLTEAIKADAQLSVTAIGLLNAIPLLAFPLLAPITPRLARTFGTEASLLVAMTLIASGAVLRSCFSVFGLYCGTIVLGAGIAIGNVLLPSLIKRAYPHAIAKVTSSYAVAMGLAAALASAVVVPLSTFSAYTWRAAAAALGIAPFLALVIWIAYLTAGRSKREERPQVEKGAKVFRSLLAWQVTLFMGTNSFIYYIAVAWIPSILISLGYSSHQAGFLHGVMQLSTALAGLLVISVVGRLPDQRWIALATSLSTGIGLAGLWLVGTWAALWVSIFGLGAGATVILALSFTGLRARNSTQAAALSAMSQAIGYSIAACGPTFAGFLYGVTGTWRSVLLVGVAAAAVMGLLGVFAGRDRFISVA